MSRMRVAAMAALCALLGAGAACAEDFAAVFGSRYEAAVSYVTAHAREWSAEMVRRGADPRVLVPVVFPEVLKYTLFRDEVETLGLSVLYVSRGPRLADFSIGRFQMKPSFVEALERALGSAPPPAFADIVAFPSTADERARRAIRLDRLRDLTWDVAYLAAFGRLTAERFDLGSLEEVERVRFLAASYNRGFLLPRAEIEAAELWRIFPRGASGWPGPYRYTDIAVDFYLRVWSALSP